MLFRNNKECDKMIKMANIVDGNQEIGLDSLKIEDALYEALNRLGWHLIVEDKLIFTCSRCNRHRLQEVSTGVQKATDISNITVDGEYDYGDHEELGQQVISHYRCMECGFVLKNARNADVDNRRSLIEWLKDYKPKLEE